MSETPDPPRASGRDRARTEAALVAAARQVLAEAGFQGFGVNAVARQAGCDKQLIYRYFGGLDGLVEALGVDLAARIEAGLSQGAAEPPRTYAELAERLILGFLDALRGDPLVQRIAAWEVAGPSPLVDRLTVARGQALGRWMARMRGDLTPPAGLDAPALNLFLIAAVQQLVLSASAAGAFSGVPLRSEADWDRVKAAALLIIQRVYA
ncbi:TetR/AcrR family transcriptional regulator [Caulobacter sp. ErkDOM-YI]|uniref:TetR/AcrR family transcriptional regulator n=1 Tax=unclassified Caulobacter TaxID=2648921 RepID=UPI003AF5E311